MGTFVFPLSNPRQKTLSQQDLKTGKDLNNQTLRVDRPICEYVDMFFFESVLLPVVTESSPKIDFCFHF